MRRRRAVARGVLTVWLACAMLVAHGPARGAAEAAFVEGKRELPVVFLEGTPYQMGRQHGELLKEDIRRCVGRVLGYFREYLRIPVVSAAAANWWLDRSWSKSWKYVPTDYMEELQGISDASGVPLKELWRLHAIPDRTYTCANFAAWGRATAGGRLIHVRNLDWNMGAGIQAYPAIFVVRPNGKRAYVNVGWAGFIGVLTGMNARGISIGQIGADTADMTFGGIPMVFLMRRVMEQAASLDEAITLITRSPRTVGTNYILADHLARRGVAIETTRSFAKVFEADDPQEHAVDYARPIPDAVFRADAAVDAVIRNEQFASGGEPRRQGMEPPTGSAYEVRYLGQAAGLLANYGRLDLEAAKHIAATIAPDSNVQSAVMAWPDLLVANAEGATPAANTTYHRFNVEQFFRMEAPVIDDPTRTPVPAKRLLPPGTAP